MTGKTNNSCRALCCLLLCMLACSSGAIPSPRPPVDSSLPQLHHTGWTLKDGAPPDIWALAQTRDGYLWLGTGAGLYRFDGVRFERIDTAQRASNITALFVDASGSLWMGYYFGGAAVLRAGTDQVDDSMGSDMPGGVVYRFEQTPDGAIWSASNGGLGRWKDGHWQQIGADWGYPYAHANWLLLDHAGVLWVSSGETLLFLRPGATHFEPTGEQTATAVLAEAPDGRLWLSDELHGLRVLPDYTQAPQSPNKQLPPNNTDVQAKRLLFARDGSLWGTDSVHGGVFRLPEPQHIQTGQALTASQIQERFRHAQGLTADIAVPLLQDREGTLWVGSNLGLNRFRRQPFHVETRVPGTSPLGYTLAPGNDGTVWVGHGSTLSALGSSVSAEHSDPLPRISYTYRGRDGALWLGGRGRLLRIAEGHRSELAVPAIASADIVEAITEDDHGDLWVSFENHGVYRHTAQGWQFKGGYALPDAAALTMLQDAHSALWFGYADSRIARLDGDAVTIYDTRQGLDIGGVMSLASSPQGLIAGGDGGIARFDGQRFASLGPSRNTALSGISGILVRADGEVWLNGLLGVVRIDGNELARASTDSTHVPRLQLFNYEDGLPGVAQQASPLPTTLADSNGRLWFATNRGLAWIDPQPLDRNSLPPPVLITGISIAGHRYAANDGLRLPRGTTSIQIDYTGLSLTIPERVHFRYRLDENGEDWQDAGTRRQAIYTHLAPGPHRFQVLAANDDGNWNERGATLDFSIEPAFFQTLWFRLACGGAAVFLLWLLYLLRLQQLTARLRMRLEARHEERERIARELHDTLLQGVQGLILRFHAIAEQLPASDTRRRIEHTLDHAETIVEQGRDRVRALRDLAQPVDDLAEAFAAFGRECAAVHDISFKVQQQHRSRQLDLLVRDEIWQIGREALFNAFQHAQASAIEIEIAYTADALKLWVRDDGRGIAGETLDGGRSGHWGLAGMRERARRLQSTLNIWSRPDLGTEIELSVPATVAYCGQASKSWVLRLFGLAMVEHHSR